jgi:tetratricopeptide (TPR) repeat protein
VPAAAWSREPYDIDRANLAFRRGQALYENRNYVDALREFQNACILNPEFADAYYAQGLCLLALDEPKMAKEEFAFAVEMSPHHTAALYNLGLCEAQLGDTARARSHFQRALALDQELRGVHFALARLAEKSGNVEGAIQELNLELAINPDSAAVHAELGYLLLREGDTPGARTHLERAIELEPGFSAGLYLDRGRVEEREERWSAADSVYTRGIRADSLDFDLWFARASNRFRQGMFEEAAVDYGIAAELDPSSVEAMFNHAVALEKIGDPENAMTAYVGALARDSTYADAHLNLAVLLGKNDQQEAAIVHLEAYLRLDPESPRAADVEKFLAQLKKNGR